MFEKDLDAIILIGIAAGEKIKKLRREKGGWTLKPDGSPVTVADRAAEDLIVNRLNNIAPGIVIVAEERVSNGQVPTELGSAFFLVDALDGTREYVNGRDEYTVNIARIEDGRPVMGVIVAPSLGIGFAGIKNSAWKFDIFNEEPNDVRAIHARSRPTKLTAAISRSHATPETLSYLEQFDVATQSSVGSSLKFCTLAEGTADIYPRFGRTMEWDIAAGEAILRASGGHVTTTNGAEMVYGKLDASPDSPFANPNFVAFGNWMDADIRKSFAYLKTK